VENVGTDLGEAIRMARELVDFSGGRLEVGSEEDPNFPAAIHIVLPVAKQTTVMVIDDNPDTLELIRRYTAGRGYRIIDVLDAARALPLAVKHRPQVIVLDVMLPDIDGWELLGRLREHPELRGIPIIVFTVLPQHQLALALGAAAFLRKPAGRETFLATLDAQSGGVGREGTD
jgi:CheY-like chemotaxis protein